MRVEKQRELRKEKRVLARVRLEVQSGKSDLSSQVGWMPGVLRELEEAYGPLSNRVIESVHMAAQLRVDALAVRENPSVAKALAVAGKLIEQSAGLLKLATQFAAEDQKHKTLTTTASRKGDDETWLDK